MKKIKLTEIFKEYQSSFSYTKLYDVIIGFMSNESIKIINDTDFNWCFTPIGYYKYCCFKPGLIDFDTCIGIYNKITNLETVKGSKCLLFEIDVKEKDIYKIYTV